MTRTKDVEGLFYGKGKIKPARVTVRATKDKLGESLSLAVEGLGVMIMIPVEPVKGMIEVKP